MAGTRRSYKADLAYVRELTALADQMMEDADALNGSILEALMWDINRAYGGSRTTELVELDDNTRIAAGKDKRNVSKGDPLC